MCDFSSPEAFFKPEIATALSFSSMLMGLMINRVLTDPVLKGKIKKTIPLS